MYTAGYIVQLHLKKDNIFFLKNLTKNGSHYPNRFIKQNTQFPEHPKILAFSITKQHTIYKYVDL